MRISSRSTHSSLSGGSVSGVRISTAWLSSTVCDLAQVIGLQRRAGRDQITDQIGAPQPRGDLDRARQRHDLGARGRARADSARAERDRSWRCACRCRDSQARRSRRPSGTASDSRQRPKSSVRTRLEARRLAARGELQALLLEHVQADQPEVAHVLLHQVRDVVVAHEQHIERHVLAEAHQLILAARELQAAAREQIERRVGQAAGLLHRELQAHVASHGVPPPCA